MRKHFRSRTLELIYSPDRLRYHVQAARWVKTERQIQQYLSRNIAGSIQVYHDLTFRGVLWLGRINNRPRQFLHSQK